MANFELRDSSGNRHSLREAWVRLGRADDNQIVVKDPAISRYHLNFYNRDGQLIVENAGAASGFFVNGTPVNSATLLNSGDRISVGTQVFEVTANGVSTGAAPQPRANNFRAGGTAIRTMPRRGASNGKRIQLYLGAILILIVIGIKSKNDDEAARKPASVNIADELATQPLPIDGYKGESFQQKSLTEVQAESRYRESLRDYYNKNFSRALLGFQEALTLNPAHERAAEYIQLTEGRMHEELEGLMKDAERSYQLLQYHRVKNQAGRALTILSDQVAGYSRRVAQEASSIDLEDSRRPQGQEETLLQLPCDRTRESKLCTRATDLLKRAREKLGEEDMLK